MDHDGMTGERDNSERSGQRGRLLPCFLLRCWSSSCVALFFTLIVIAWGVIAFFLAEEMTSGKVLRLINRERMTAAEAASAVDTNIRLRLAHVSSIPKVLAKQPDIIKSLSNNLRVTSTSYLTQQKMREFLAGFHDLVQLSDRLESIHNELAIDQIWVMNVAGDCIASGGFSPDASATGVNYADREYFQQAKREGVGRQFAVGRTTNAPGLYFSSAVMADHKFLGAVIVKVNVSRFSRMIESRNVFVADENGVIIMAGESSFFMKAHPGARIDSLPVSEVFNRYKRHQFGRIAIDPVMVAGELMFRLEGHERPMILARLNNVADNLSVWAFGEVPQVWETKSEQWWIFLLLFLAGASVFASATAGLIYLLRRREHQAEMANVNERLVKLNEELLLQARYDVLTGCANRRYFLEKLDLELSRAGRFNQHCSLAMLDIDHFKRVNDRHGHATGDALLQHFSKMTMKCLRSSDLLGRLGGEEFALLMPQTSLAGALDLAERIRIMIEQSSAPESSDAALTVSVGVVQWRGKEESVDSFVARADRAMYEAKNAGRNRVVADINIEV